MNKTIKSFALVTLVLGSINVSSVIAGDKEAAKKEVTAKVKELDKASPKAAEAKDLKKEAHEKAKAKKQAAHEKAKAKKKAIQEKVSAKKEAVKAKLKEAKAES